MLATRRVSGAARCIRLPCRRWSCQVCSRQHRAEVLHRLQHLAAKAGPAARWWYVIAHDAKADKQTRRRADGAPHLRVLRQVFGRPDLWQAVGLGERPVFYPAQFAAATWIISAVPSTPPPAGRMVSPRTAITLLGRGALHPDRLVGLRGKTAGVARVTWGKGWRPPRRRPTYTPIAITRDHALAKQAITEAAAHAEQTTGYRPREGVDLPVGGPLAPETWSGMVGQKWEELYLAARRNRH